MNTTKKVVIIGDNIIAALITQILSNEHMDITVISSGSPWASLQLLNSMTVEVLPQTERTQLNLELLKSALNLASPQRQDANSLIFETIPTNRSFYTFEETEMKPFAGFGDSRAKSLLPLSQFQIQQILKVTPRLNELMKALKPNSEHCKMIPFSPVTGLDELDNKIQAVLLSGGRRIEGDLFIFTEPPQKWISVLPSDITGPRLKGRIAKSNYWAEIKLIFDSTRKPHTLHDNDILFITPPSIRNEPFVGQFNDDDTSVWISYLEGLESEDSDSILNTIKFMKKTLQKVFENTGSNFNKEAALIVQPLAAIDLSWTTQDIGIKEHFTNSIWAFKALSQDYEGSAFGLLHDLDCARRALAEALIPIPEKRISLPSMLSVADAPLS